MDVAIAGHRQSLTVLVDETKDVIVMAYRWAAQNNPEQGSTRLDRSKRIPIFPLVKQIRTADCHRIPRQTGAALGYKDLAIGGVN